MKRALIVYALFLVSGLAIAEGSPWVGTWKVDLGKSQLTGETFKFAKGTDGRLQYSDGTAYHYSFAIDGKEYKTYENRTTTWVTAGENAWTSVIKQDGKAIFEIHRELSADGKTLKITGKGTMPDGSAGETVSMATRVSPGKGLLGTWRVTHVDKIESDLMVISQPAPGTFRFEVPRLKYVAEGKTDGTVFEGTGPMVPAGYMTSLKQPSPSKLTLVYTLNGKADSYETMSLAADGKSYTDLSWSANKPTEKTKAVYARQ